MASNDQYTDSTFSFTVDGNSLFTSSSDSTITINTTADTTYTLSGNTDTISVSDGTFTIDTDSADWLSSISINDTRISPEEVERMCKMYPGLEKVWRNFKSIYDMCKQDFEGKKKAGEVNDFPF